jgi:DNA polymerase sigma
MQLLQEHVRVFITGFASFATAWKAASNRNGTLNVSESVYENMLSDFNRLLGDHFDYFCCCCEYGNMASMHQEFRPE